MENIVRVWAENELGCHLMLSLSCLCVCVCVALSVPDVLLLGVL